MAEAMYTAINMDIQETQERHVKHNTFPEWHGIIIWARLFTADLSSCPFLVMDSTLQSLTLSLHVKVLLCRLPTHTSPSITVHINPCIVEAMAEAMYTGINMDVQETHEWQVKHYTFATLHGIIIWAMSFTADLSS
uniref:Uncharacterized protein n=1 Tax=Oryza barthii TaxID=65489 RepID=A0A0D3HJP1_9ORYZ